MSSELKVNDSFFTSGRKDLDSWAETIPRQVIEKIEKIVISCLFIRLFSD
ncbi:hypothetical protein M123_0379 [Bacteroides fragilis str. 3976T8]|uniref:Uncharacterized protein n=1 Tax=Bacteroides fragilis str. 3976T8 TaxID=1339314 RepID=A0A016EE55_BACFG|nr:hypothetical protein M123_0379 [Bacteroides fragilis str. 3976T8]